jgi:CheY-like chemotaxis protein
MANSSQAGARLRVLVIDDNQDAADSLCCLLSIWGFSARAAYSGEEGLRAAEQQRPDCVLLDLAMPQMSGFEVARRMRSDPTYREVPIVALTGCSDEKSRREAASAGFSHYLVKAVEPAKVRALLDSLER